MTPTDFTARLTAGTSVVTVTLALVAAWLVGWTAGIGVLAGGALALVDFRWLVAHVAATMGTGRARGGWLIGAGVRLGVLFASCAALLITGAVHPVALVLGLSVLPCQVIVQGLRLARRGI